MKSLLLCTTLLVSFYSVYRFEPLFERPLVRRALVSGVVAFIIFLTLLLYPSEPETWTLDKYVLFLAEPRFDLLAILGSTVTGAIMVGLFFLGLYWANRR